MQPTTSYDEALTYLYGFTDYEQRGFAAYAPEFYDLERVERLLAMLGNPHHSFQSVHIAGTKGKGSTSAMIESILRAAGYQTGLYTSPHLHTFCERIQSSGQLIPRDDLVRLVEEMRSLVDKVEGITTFEVMTCLAFSWFAEKGAEWAVVEVGLGGRLDATNVLMPALAVITSISRDHMAILGDTLTEIAAEKAGIIKPGVPVVSAPQTDEALAVIEATCQQREAPLTLVGRAWTWQRSPSRPEASKADPRCLDGQTFTILHGDDVLADLQIPLLGEFQLTNATTAVAGVSLLRVAGAVVSPSSIRTGLGSVHWPGRMEILGRAPLVVADSAHNGDSARKLIIALRAHCDFDRLIVVLGASADHATPGLMQALLSGADWAIATQAQHPRAAQPGWLQARAENLGFPLVTSDTVAQALEMALEHARPDDLICCTGSVFVAADARAAWFARQGKPLPPSDSV
jgi:dihydrofolate synthase/folylpolyglutamate synthase